ncbi:MAG: M28 family peptidase [Saprospiraceae bacterium]
MLRERLLVMELARVMSKFAYKHTIVFMVTTGEEQGLIGATAFADYCFDNNVPIKAVLNNDVIGGIICGKTSSPPSCPGKMKLTATQVRLFSSGSLFSKHKQLARYIKLEYQEELLNQVEVPMMLTIMSSEDRAGRVEIIFHLELKTLQPCASLLQMNMEMELPTRIILTDNIQWMTSRCRYR